MRGNPRALVGTGSAVRLGDTWERVSLARAPTRSRRGAEGHTVGSTANAIPSGCASCTRNLFVSRDSLGGLFSLGCVCKISGPSPQAKRREVREPPPRCRDADEQDEGYRGKGEAKRAAAAPVRVVHVTRGSPPLSPAWLSVPSCSWFFFQIAAGSSPSGGSVTCYDVSQSYHMKASQGRGLVFIPPPQGLGCV